MPHRTIGIAIPNYNYASYIEQAVRSALDQGAVVAQVHVSDNASTDDSLAVLRTIDDPRLSVSSNQTNLGFARNVDCAVGGLTTDWALVLSSDDLLEPGALDRYAAALAAGHDDDDHIVLGARSAADADGNVRRFMGRDPRYWHDDDLDRALSSAVGADVYRLSGATLLGRTMPLMRNPFPFLTAMYPMAIWRATGGYTGRLVNPDKWFAWKAAAAADQILWVDVSTARYRVHDQNQTAQMQAIGALKFLVDEYTSTFEVSDSMLGQAGLTRSELQGAFVRHDCIVRALALLADDDAREARRHLDFAAATFPTEARWMRLAVKAAAYGGPVGVAGARLGAKVLGSKS